MQSEPEPLVYQVSELNLEAKQLLETTFPLVWVTGEISNLASPGSGHLYFSLKDKLANVKCAFFKQSKRYLDFTPHNGQHVLLQARVTLYETRGDFQLIIQQMQLAGDGALQLAFLKLKQQLAAEGLFDLIHKKNIPTFAKTIGVITSQTGAVIQDIIKVVKRRSKITSLILYPTLVQGANAATHIVQAIQTANRRKECDVLLLARGGGSLEDLWSFNEEIVARAIFNSQLPIVSAIGHEIDFTIADFVADLRAATPSVAAEIVTPDFNQCLRQWLQTFHQLRHHAEKHVTQAKQALTSLQKRLRHPRQQLDIFANQTRSLAQQLMASAERTLLQKQTVLHHVSQQLHTVSPLKTLERGYAIATLAQSKTIIQSSETVHINDRINVRLAKGQLLAQVLGINPPIL